MRITERDVEVMGWILEEKFMTERQIRRVFWRGTTEKSRNAYKRINDLVKAGFLITADKSLSRDVVYCVSRKGVRELKVFNRSHGLEIHGDAGYTNYKHDLVVTDLRILFNECGYTHWLSERLLSNQNQLKRIPDGMVFSNGKYTAIEYESSQKSKRRYRKIFIDYELDRHVDNVLYITGTLELAQRISKQVSAWHKPHFVWIGDIQRDTVNAKLKSLDGECSLRKLLGDAQ